jgi:type II secretory pathway predicted ATPase ExeA
LRLLTNADFDSRSPFAGILVGQPTLSRRLRMGAFATLDQRVAVRFALSLIDLGESSTDLRHHLALVGRSDPLFADDAVARRLHRVANGLPRALNNAATAALVAATADGKVPVDDVSAKRAAAELTRD